MTAPAADTAPARVIAVSDTTTAAATGRGPVARREAIRRRLIEEGFARVEDLAREFDVHLMTVHRDLDALAAEGWITKIRGGATANPSALLDAGVRERMAAMRLEKEAIADLAADLLGHAQAIFLDDSTTALGLVRHLPAHAPITLATNFVPAVLAASEHPVVDLQLLGGEYHARQESCQGQQTVTAIENLHADVFFMSTTAVSAGRCLHRSEATVVVRKAFMRNASRSVLLVDHAKFGRPAPHVLCELERFDVIITDDGIDAHDLADLRERCPDVRVAAVHH